MVRDTGDPASGAAGAPDRPATSTRFDRVSRPDPAAARDRDGRGKEALYSTSPTSRPARPIEVRCRRCDVRLGLPVREAVRLLRPPWLINPTTQRLWTRCPACSRRSWLEVRPGPPLRALLERPASR